MPIKAVSVLMATTLMIVAVSAVTYAGRREGDGRQRRSQMREMVHERQVEARLHRSNVIFLHADGAGANHWHAARSYWFGPDATMNFDRLPEIALYRGHMLDLLGGTSNGGATTHAFGYKVDGRGSYGKDGDGLATPPTDRYIQALSGFDGSIMREAAAKGLPTGIVNDGNIGEPGTGAFLAEVGNRNNWDEIARQIVQGRPGQNDPRPYVILGGGERNFLPRGVQGVHGPGDRGDSLNLIEELQNAGYVVIRTRAEFNSLMSELAARPDYAPRVLGLFAHHHTFNDRPEEELIARGLLDTSILADDKRSQLVLFGTLSGASGNPPTVAEMTEMALTILQRAAAKDRTQFFLVVEPESIDNFGNANNSIGTLTATRIADEMVGVVLNFIDTVDRRTMLLTAADSDASGMQIIPQPMVAGVPQNVGTVTANRTGVTAQDIHNPLDGLTGRGTRAFVAEPDQFGQYLAFGVAWAGGPDFSGGIVSRAAGKNAWLLSQPFFTERFDNIDVYRVMYAALFRDYLPYPQGQTAPSR